MSKLIMLASLPLLLLSTPAAADPWKDESGHGRDRYGDYWGDHDPRDRYRGGWDSYDRGWSYRVPRGHLPPPGMCRVWFPDRPAGQQPAPTSCNRARRLAARYGGDVIWGSRRR